MGTEGVSAPVLKEKLTDQAVLEIPDCLFLWSQKGQLVGIERLDRDIVRFCEFWKVFDRGILYLFNIYFYLSGIEIGEKANQKAMFKKNDRGSLHFRYNQPEL